MKEHHSDGRCMYCGGSVDAKGMAMGGEVEAESGEFELPDDTTSQSAYADELDEEARRNFVAAVRRKGVR